MMPMMGGANGGPMAAGGGIMPPAMPLQQPSVDPMMLEMMTGPQMMAQQPMDPAVYQAIQSMLGPQMGMGQMMAGPMGPGGIPPTPAPPDQGQAMTPWQQALMSGSPGMGMGGAAGMRGLPQMGGGY